MADPAGSTAPRHAAERALTREDFPVLYPVTTRWSDNDMFGHLNNAVYYQLFDTAINGWLAEVTGDDPVTTRVIGVVAESRCVFFGEVGFPKPVTVGLRVARLGRTSVGYELGVFGGGVAEIAAYGQWTHVYVDRDTRVPTAPPPVFRDAFEAARTGAGREVVR
jgi:acyl-CoA thioester hydrolase